MKIDEAAFERAIYSCPAWRDVARALIQAYLAALPSAEPGRDRIAVVVNRYGNGTTAILAPLAHLDEDDWKGLEARIEDISGPFEGPFARAIIRCNLPRPAEPVEVSGTVEGVEP